jgi:hypothetical protein
MEFDFLVHHMTKKPWNVLVLTQFTLQKVVKIKQSKKVDLISESRWLQFGLTKLFVKPVVDCFE